MWTCRQCGYVTTDDESIYCGRCGIAKDSPDSGVYTLYLTGFSPANKIRIIKAIREMSRLGLKEAKDLVEQSPQPVLTNLTREIADRLLSTLRAAGGEGEVHPAGITPNHLSNPMPIPVTPLQPKPTSGCSGIFLGIVVLLSIAWCLCNR